MLTEYLQGAMYKLTLLATTKAANNSLNGAEVLLSADCEVAGG